MSTIVSSAAQVITSAAAPQNNSYAQIAANMAAMANRMWQEKLLMCTRSINTMEHWVNNGDVKVDSKVVYCRRIWAEFNALPASLRNFYTVDIAEQLTDLLETFYEIRSAARMV